MTDLRSRRRQVFKGVGAATAALLILLLVVACGGTATTTPTPTTSASQEIVGSWIGDASGTKGLITFHQDGTLIETEQIDQAPPHPGSAGQGVWVSTGQPHEFAMTFLKLYYDTNGDFFGLAKEHGTIQVNGDTFTTSIEVVLTDQAGKAFLSDGYTVTATRIKAEGT